MAIKFALKDPKSVAVEENRAKAEAKSAQPLASSAPDGTDDSGADRSGSDLFDGKPAEQKRKRKK
ncbi:hypothetical protein [Phyllobacterium zundukense]|uniref:Uncharacterized protein n=1 Tax=Phyllobacterium zundukense TaxID=1867719 RepID=A0A2N9VZL4_9HYPH|nr:hypothetical protein [Phyllobacterium zundukense]ATU90819.1 hypothetical protein BLM14_03545 [Phyllobacterium zundukense]PIO44932.1 hypothetical protein B5P45_11275 [Phyllobacterium zundukense]